MELSRALWSLKEVLLVGFFLQIGLMGWPSLATLGGALLLALLLPLKAALFFFILIRLPAACPHRLPDRTGLGQLQRVCADRGAIHGQ
jgi:predicted Kef-type K+ transport protein